MEMEPSDRPAAIVMARRAEELRSQYWDASRKLRDSFVILEGALTSQEEKRVLRLRKCTVDALYEKLEEIFHLFKTPIESKKILEDFEKNSSIRQELKIEYRKLYPKSHSQATSSVCTAATSCLEGACDDETHPEYVPPVSDFLMSRFLASQSEQLPQVKINSESYDPALRSSSSLPTLKNYVSDTKPSLLPCSSQTPTATVSSVISTQPRLADPYPVSKGNTLDPHASSFLPFIPRTGLPLHRPSLPPPRPALSSGPMLSSLTTPSVPYSLPASAQSFRPTSSSFTIPHISCVSSTTLSSSQHGLLPNPSPQVSHLPPASSTGYRDVIHQPVSSASTLTRQQDNLDILTQTMSDALSVRHLPEPEQFSGEASLFPYWKSNFELLISRLRLTSKEKLMFLQRYLTGDALEAVRGYFLIPDEGAYALAMNTLDSRYGDPVQIASSFRKKLDSWPDVSTKKPESLRKFVDFLKECLSAKTLLGELGILDDHLYQMFLSSKLPEWLDRSWGRKVHHTRSELKRYPLFSEFVRFLQDEAEVLASMQTDRSSRFQPLTSHPTPPNRNRKQGSTFSTHEGTANVHCVICETNSHPLLECRKFLTMSPADRVAVLVKFRLCFSCTLSSKHVARDCKNKPECETCGKPHLTLLHGFKFQRRRPDPPVRNRDFDNASSSNVSQDLQSAPASSHKISSEGSGFHSPLTTLIVPVMLSSEDDPELEIKTYALLDTMSSISFVSDSVQKRLRARSENVHLKLNTMTSVEKSIESKRISGLRVRPLRDEKMYSLPPVYTTQNLKIDPSHIPTSDTARAFTHLEHLAGCIPSLQVDCEAGLLIGYDAAELLIPLEIIRGSPCGMRTPLGWSIIGGHDIRSKPNSVLSTHHTVLNTSDFDQQVAYVYRCSVSEVTPADCLKILEKDFEEKDFGKRSVEDEKFIDLLSSQIRVNEEGHLEMPLPFKDENVALPDNRHTALKRAESLARQLRNKESYCRHYCEFMRQIIEEGHAERVPSDEIDNVKRWYIPHHGVYHPKKPDKVRVVFDCSATQAGRSLNQELLSGPDLLNALSGVLCRFRMGNTAFTCDVEKMFHQFHVSPLHRDYLRFLWWSDEDFSKPPVDFRMRVHLFGAVSSPGCANFGLQYIGANSKQTFPASSDFLRDDFYVDDGLHASDSPETAIEVLKGAIDVCADKGLRLHKIVSNSEQVRKSVPSSALSKKVECALMSEDSPLSSEPVLGMKWSVEADTLFFDIAKPDKPNTRRGVLSSVASLYDPLGLLAPMILRGRSILQQACKDGLGWDEPLPFSLQERWEIWKEELELLNEIQVPRNLLPFPRSSLETLQLHHFSDASEIGYGQCSYLRSVSTTGEVHCGLLTAKGRVAPLKQMTIPRLELQAANLSVEIAKFLQTELHEPNLEHFFWTDSEIVLAYLSNQTKRFHVFVANRIGNILRFSSPEQWNHVPSDQNPADLASRGKTLNELKNSEWFSGPAFLKERELPSQSEPSPVPLESLEVKQVRATSASSHCSFESRFKRFSSLRSLERGLAVILRCIHRYKKLSTSDVELRRLARAKIISLTQKEHLSATTPSNKRLFEELDVFQANDETFRVGGRLKKMNRFHEAHPVLIPRDSHFAFLLAKEAHENLGHSGRPSVIARIRQNGFWITGIRRVVRSVTTQCVPCKRLYASAESQKMSNLPEDRVEPAPPFANCGIDCFGPFVVKEGRKQFKRYGLIVTCLATRAIHIEVLEDMSADSFLLGLRNVIAIRGQIFKIRCDCGTNFVGASRELKGAWQEMDRDKLRIKLIDMNIEWVFNPPSASHFGGVWERLIRSVRTILNGLLSKSEASLTSFSLRTLLYEVMAIVNSRPLSVESLEDPSGPLPLTPNHILTQRTCGVLPPPGAFSRSDNNIRRRWRQVQWLADEFWQRWRKDYLSTLQARRKWTKRRPNLDVGDIVLLRDDAICRADWKTGRISAVLPSDDGLVRKCEVTVPKISEGAKSLLRTPSVYERPVHKLVLLIKGSSPSSDPEFPIDCDNQ